MNPFHQIQYQRILETLFYKNGFNLGFLHGWVTRYKSDFHKRLTLCGFTLLSLSQNRSIFFLPHYSSAEKAPPALAHRHTARQRGGNQ